MSKLYSSHFEMSWKDLTYTVPGKKENFFSRWGKESTTPKPEPKHLVHDVSGHVHAGEMVAIMGPSGAGKSTFLDVLSGRKKASSGTISFGAEHRDIKSISSYVEQEDALIGVLTVRETLWYSAKLSLPPSTTKEEIDQRTDMIVSGLGLSHVASNRIGTPIQRGISGGQKRRVTIGCSLVTLPRVLFLDEPTSGLDISTAYEVMKAIKNLAKQHNIAVLATIHSPNWEIFDLFDRTILLARGQTMYNGSVDGVASYFESLGHPCPNFTNPADHMMGLVSTDFLDPKLGADSLRSVEEGRIAAPFIPGSTVAAGDTETFAEAWKSRAAATPNIFHEVERKSTHHSDLTEATPAASITQTASLFSRTGTLTRRNFVNYARNVLAYGVRLAMYVGMGVLLATVWVNLAQTDSRLNDRLSVHFFSVAFLGFMAVAGIPAFLEERSVMRREQGNGLYGPLPFVLANTFVIIPFLFICTLVFTVICYWSIGLHPGAGSFFRFLAFVYLGVLAAETQALMVAALVPIFVAALSISAFLNGWFMVVQGYFVRELPAFWYYWAHFIDYQTFAFQILVKNDFSGLTFPCAGSVSGNTCQCSFPSSLISQGICAVRGEDVLESLGFNGISIRLYAFILLIITFVYRIIFYLILKLQS